MCKHTDLREGAFVADRASGQLYEVRESPSKTHVRLSDVRLPVGSRSFTPMPIAQALSRLEVIEPAPDPANTASEAEWGAAG